MKIQIKSIYGKLLFEGDFSTMAEAVASAIKGKADLSFADLSFADLSFADLRSADLSYCDLSFADLSFADPRSANPRSANLSYCDLSFADPRSANLRSANLRSANLRSANLRSANLKDGSKVGNSKRPLFTMGQIGRRQDNLMAFSTDKGIRIQAGCFFGPLDEFSNAVKKTHGDNEHGKEYAAAIKMIEAHFEIWKE